MNLLITGAVKMDDTFFSKIENMGHSIFFLQDERDNLIGIDPTIIDGVICNGFFLYHPIEQYKNLKFIQFTSAGLDRAPLDYISSHNIKCYNARGVYSIPIAEYVLCSVLCLYKKMGQFADNQKKACWEKQRNIIELYGKNICIVGCGSVGTECAKRFSAFGCNVYGVDIISRKDECFSSIVSSDYLDDVITNADVVVLTLPLQKETYHMFNNQHLKHLKNHSIFVNVARGAIVDINDLINEIPRLTGTVLDVFENEPLSVESPLWNMENVIITPHNSFEGEMNNERLQKIILKNLRMH